MYIITDVMIREDVVVIDVFILIYSLSLREGQQCGRCAWTECALPISC